ncbi:MAG TPA: mycofactocin biosynthesis peptidyl-dipeptidase MftE [Mycobacteriales bacterium]
MSRLADLTSPEVARLGDVVLVVPLGSTEQHGPHLPLSTDADVAVALASRVSARPDVVVAPPVPYGSSGEHEGFAGTLSVGQAALELLLVELVRSATGTFGRVLLLSAHGGNAEPVNRAVDRLRREARDVRAWSPRWRGDAHAGRVETSVQLALDPARVRPAREAGNPAPLESLLPVLRTAGVLEVSPNGVLGDPSGATAAEGAALLAAAAADLAGLLDRWPPAPAGGPVPTAPRTESPPPARDAPTGGPR